MKIQAILPALVFAALLCFQLNIDVVAQGRQIDNTNDTKINQRHTQTHDQTHTDINTPTLPPGGGLGGTATGGGLGGTATGGGFIDDHDNGLGGGTPADPNGSENIICSTPEFWYCGNYSNIEWTAPQNVESYDIIFSLIGPNNQEEIQEYFGETSNFFPLLDIARDFDEIVHDHSSDGIPVPHLNITSGYDLYIYITPNFAGTCTTLGARTLTGIYSHDQLLSCPAGGSTGTTAPIFNGDANSPDPGDICCQGAKGFAALDGGGKKEATNMLPSSALLITPNPVQTNANITVDLPESNPLSINIYSANGQYIQEVVANNQMSKGIHNFSYDTSHLPTGIYYCQVQSGDKFITKKIVKMN